MELMDLHVSLQLLSYFFHQGVAAHADLFMVLAQVDVGAPDDEFVAFLVVVEFVFIEVV